MWHEYLSCLARVECSLKWDWSYQGAMPARKRVQKHGWNQTALRVFLPVHAGSQYRRLLECVDSVYLGVVVSHGGADTSLALNLLEKEDDLSKDHRSKSPGHTGRS